MPFAGQADIYRPLKGRIDDGAVVLDATSPLATSVGGKAWQIVRPWHGSAAEQAAAILGPGTADRGRVPHDRRPRRCTDLASPIDSDVMVCGDDVEAKALVGGVIEEIPGMRWVDCGALSMARITETLTALLISVEPPVQGEGVGVPDRGPRDVGTALSGELVRIDDTSLFVETRGDGDPLILLHGGPGLDHHEFADYLDPLADEFRLLFVDLRACGRSEPCPPGTWTLERHAQDVIMLARALRARALRGARAFVRGLRRATERRGLPRDGGADDREQRDPIDAVDRGRRAQPGGVRAGRTA